MLRPLAFGELPVSVCPYCRRSCPSGSVECPACGRKIGGRCEKCGEWVRNDWLECPHCGEPWTLGLLQAARNRRKQSDRLSGEPEESLAVLSNDEVPQADAPSEPAKADSPEKERGPSLRRALLDFGYLEERNSHARTYLLRRGSALKAWALQIETYFGLVFFSMLCGMPPALWVAAALLHLPTGRDDPGLLIIFPGMMVTGLIGVVVLNVLANRWASSVGITHQRILKWEELSSSKKDGQRNV